jgi:hypothetical protein
MEEIEKILQEIVVINPTQFNAISFTKYLREFEHDNKFNFPSDYKIFANRLGTGEFDDGFMEFIAPFKGLDEEESTFIRQQIKNYPSRYKKHDEWTIGLIDRAVFFAIDGASNYYFWDTDTYNKSDDSYDIFCLQIEDFEDVVKAGRRFSDLLNDFCIKKTKKYLTYK